MRTLLRLSCVVSAVLAIPAALGQAEYWPTCDEPQLIAPAQQGAEAWHAAIAWNGNEFAVLYVDAGGLIFQRFFADGTAAGVPVRIRGGAYISYPNIVWNGTDYGIAWREKEMRQRIWFARLSPSGDLLADPVEAAIPWAESLTGMDLGYGPPGYLIAYGDDWGSSAAIRRTWLSPEGSVLRSDAAGGSWTYEPAVTWSSTGQTFVTVWSVIPVDGASSLWARNDTGPAVLLRETSLLGFAALCDSSVGPGLAWSGGAGVHFSTLYPDGSALKSGDAVVTASDGGRPQVLWTGAEFGVFWNSGNVWFRRVSPDGVPLAQPAVAALATSPFHSDNAFGRHGFLTVTSGVRLSTQPMGCHAPSAPLCPESVDSYSVTGTSAVISWLPVPDDRTDVAYYQVFRNDELAGRVAYPFFSDVGLAPGATYDYDVRTVNAAQMVSAPCPLSNIAVTTSDSLQLRVERRGADVHLAWTGIDGPAYRVMRGTSPRSMSEIQRTSSTETDDTGAAAGKACFFYSIDPPR